MLENLDMSQEQATARFSINRSISVGDIVVCISLVTMGVFSFTSLDKRLTLAESSLLDVKSNFIESKVDARETQKTMEQLRTEVLRMSYTIERVANQQTSTLQRKVTGNGSN